jgi:hypothetical protein
MSTLELVSKIVGSWSAPRADGGRVLVPTFSFYPSNAMIQISVEGAADNFIVSDGGGAVDVLHGAGGFNVDARRMLTNLSRRKNLLVSNEGWIVAQKVSSRRLTAAISEVMETSRNGAELLLRSIKLGEARDFRRAINTTLELRFNTALSKGVHLAGASNKMHTFDYAVRIAPETTVVIDTVVPDSSSVNAALVSHLDLKNAKQENVRQAIVYDDAENWKSADLALLSIAAPPIPFSRFTEQLDRLAA